jgi:hypothetical protein
VICQPGWVGARTARNEPLTSFVLSRQNLGKSI